MKAASIAREKLRAWYRAHCRDMPWRRTKDPYAIWVSEIMLQQTRVAAAIPYYERFLKRFPDVRALARARESTVLAHWSGLGYYRRARMLHAAAKEVARDGLPDTIAGWRALPGVGPYTAAAIASIAHGAPAAVVDGNVERVLSRLHARARTTAKEIQALADAWLDREAPGDHNQAVMELGALVCGPRTPLCARCPVRDHCRGKTAPERYPAPRKRAVPVAERRRVAFVVKDGRVLLRKRSGEARLDGFWELPPSFAKGAPLATVKHSIVEKRLVLEVHRGRPGRDGRWFSPAQLRRVPLGAADRKCLESVGFL